MSNSDICREMASTSRVGGELEQLKDDIEQIQLVLGANDDHIGTGSLLRSPPSSKDGVQIAVGSPQGNAVYNVEADYDKDLQDSSPLLCLQQNMEYQRAIEEEIKKLHFMIATNNKRQNEINQELNGDKSSSLQSKSTFKSFFNRYFQEGTCKEGTYTVPPMNKETKLRQKLGYQSAHVGKPRKWQPREKTILHKAVSSEQKKRLMQPLINKQEVLERKLTSPLELEEVTELKKDINNLKLQINAIRTKSDRELLSEPFDDGMDWQKISCVDFDGDRTAMQCMLAWKHMFHPSINNSKAWTNKEDEQLLEIIEQHDAKDWDAIAEELDNGRVGWQCIQRYQQHLNKDHVSKKFTPEEDKLIVEIIEKLRVGNMIPFTKVAYFLEGQSSRKILTRWHNKLNPDLKRGRFTELEDQLLIAGVNQQGQNWVNISKTIPGRTPTQVRDRWINCINPELKKGTWSQSEDIKLMGLVRKYGAGCWAKISSEIGGRRPNSVLWRYKKLTNTYKRSKKQRKERKVKPSKPKLVINHRILKMIAQHKRVAIQTVLVELVQQHHQVHQENQCNLSTIDKLNALPDDCSLEQILSALTENTEDTSSPSKLEKKETRGRKRQAESEKILDQSIQDAIENNSIKVPKKRGRPFKYKVVEDKRRLSNPGNQSALFPILLKSMDIDVKQVMPLISEARRQNIGINSLPESTQAKKIILKPLNIAALSSASDVAYKRQSHKPMALPSQSAIAVPVIVGQIMNIDSSQKGTSSTVTITNNHTGNVLQAPAVSETATPVTAAPVTAAVNTMAIAVPVANKPSLSAASANKTGPSQGVPSTNLTVQPAPILVSVPHANLVGPVNQLAAVSTSKLSSVTGTILSPSVSPKCVMPSVGVVPRVTPAQTIGSPSERLNSSPVTQKTTASTAAIVSSVAGLTNPTTVVTVTTPTNASAASVMQTTTEPAATATPVESIVQTLKSSTHSKKKALSTCKKSSSDAEPEPEPRQYNCLYPGHVTVAELLERKRGTPNEDSYVPPSLRENKTNIPHKHQVFSKDRIPVIKPNKPIHLNSLPSGCTVFKLNTRGDFQTVGQVSNPKSSHVVQGSSPVRITPSPAPAAKKRTPRTNFDLPILPPSTATLTGFQILLEKKKQLKAMSDIVKQTPVKKSNENLVTLPGQSTLAFEGYSSINDSTGTKNTNLDEHRNLDSQGKRSTSSVDGRNFDLHGAANNGSTEQNNTELQKAANSSSAEDSNTISHKATNTNSVEQGNSESHLAAAEQRNSNSDALDKIRESESYKLLRARFTSLFSWPMLMSQTKLDPGK
ncbi:uncharacterized protein LOC102801483 [Saccoglossus kowalevskii]|uniref:Uncharacterized protein LOC102801483 n=1 Tax=Saccoglossus kowalevskii TaxID=10224 RepID=A0ABM0M891_SACKO|nr:PREDICTED: uncharacterized protein LOC102801483 [Saccoglossus kowalevskii]